MSSVSITYVRLPKNSGNLTIRQFLTVNPSFRRLLRSRLLGHVYNDPSVFPMHTWKFSNMNASITLAFLRGSPQSCQNDALSAVISFWGIGKCRRGRGQANKGWECGESL